MSLQSLCYVLTGKDKGLFEDVSYFSHLFFFIPLLPSLHPHIMSIIQQDISLKAFNTFGIDARAAFYAKINQVDDIYGCLDLAKNKPFFVLGGGSNVLFTDHVDGLTLHMATRGISYTADDKFHYVEACAGEHWHDLVIDTLEHKIGGLENLSLIPGQVGAAPIQNIGAYGVELCDVFHSLTALHIPTLELHKFDLNDCRFGYRSSIFKTTEKGQYIILSVKLALAKSHTPVTSYGDIERKLQEMNVVSPNAYDVSRAVIQIRQSKLPNPAQIGNAGSFFKNPVVPFFKYESLKIKYAEMPSFMLESGDVKIPAGWLIEKAGWKGRRVGNCGVHTKQALVLVNYGEATGREILNLAQTIQNDIHDCFGIKLEMEVNVIG